MARVLIRKATTARADLRALIALGAEMHPQSSFAEMQFDPQHWGMFLIELIAGPQHVVFLAEVQGEVVGGMAASVVTSMFGQDLVASEHGLFVRPERRSQGAADALIKAYLSWAKSQGAKRVNVGNSAGMDDSRYVRLMQRHGFEPAGSLLYQTL